MVRLINGWLANNREDPWRLPAVIGVIMVLSLFLIWAVFIPTNSNQDRSNQRDTGPSDPQTPSGGFELKVESGRGQPEPSASAGLQGGVTNLGITQGSQNSSEIQGSPSPQGSTGSQDLQGSRDALQPAGQEPKRE